MSRYSNSNDLPLGCHVVGLIILAIVWITYTSFDMVSNGITDTMMEDFVADKYPEYGIERYTDSGNDNIAQAYRDVTFVVDMNLHEDQEDQASDDKPSQLQIEVRCFDNGWASPHVCRSYGTNQ